MSRSEILQFSVDIPYYEWKAYESAVKKGVVEQFFSIQLGFGESVKVMKCKYDEMGYHKIEFMNNKN